MWGRYNLGRVYPFSGLDRGPTANGIPHGSCIPPDPCCPPWACEVPASAGDLDIADDEEEEEVRRMKGGLDSRTHKQPSTPSANISANGLPWSTTHQYGWLYNWHTVPWTYLCTSNCQMEASRSARLPHCCHLLVARRREVSRRHAHRRCAMNVLDADLAIAKSTRPIDLTAPPNSKKGLKRVFHKTTSCSNNILHTMHTIPRQFPCWKLQSWSKTTDIMLVIFVIKKWSPATCNCKKGSSSCKKTKSMDEDE